MTMTHLYWLGGSPCAGKSTIAEILASRYNLHYFSCDNAFTRHQQQSDPITQPTLYGLAARTCDEIWLVPVAKQVARVIAIYEEEFPLILADLQALPSDRPILAEGAALMPALVAQQISGLQQAAWVVPTPAFQRHHYAQRPWIRDVLKECSDPGQAFANWMQRDEAFAHYIAKTATQHGLPLLRVDGKQTADQNANWVASQWGLQTREP